MDGFVFSDKKNINYGREVKVGITKDLTKYAVDCVLWSNCTDLVNIRVKSSDLNIMQV